MEELDHRVGDDVHVPVGVDPARDREPDQLELRVPVRAVRVAPAETMPRSIERTPDSTNKAAASDWAGRSSWVRCGRKAAASRKTACPPMGRTIGDAGLDELLAEVADLADPVLQVVVVDGLAQAHGHRLEVAAGQATVGRHPLEKDDELRAFWRISSGASRGSHRY